MLAAGALARATLPLDTVSRPSLLAYQAALCVIAVGLLAGLLTPDLERVDVTDLVVELGTERTPGLRAALSRALGDPSLDVGYWYAGAGAFVGADGRSLDLPDPGSARTVTFVEHEGERVAALVHDPAALEDPQVWEAVETAARLAAANGRLQREVRNRVVDIEDSRRRILRTADEERIRLERRLHDGAERRLLEVATMLDRGRRSATASTTSELVVSAEDQVQRALEELRRLARGIHPRLLTEAGLEAALQTLVDGFPVPVDLEVETPRLPRSRRGGGVLRLRGGAGERGQVRGGVARAGLGRRRRDPPHRGGRGRRSGWRGPGPRLRAARPGRPGRDPRRHDPGGQRSPAAGRASPPRSLSAATAAEGQPILVQGLPDIRNASPGSIPPAGTRVRLPSSSRLNVNV